MIKYTLWVVVMTYTLHAAPPSSEEKVFTAVSEPKHKLACEALLESWRFRAEFNPTVKHAHGQCQRHKPRRTRNERFLQAL